MLNKRPAWYLDKKFIRPKTRHSWTSSEKIRAFLLTKAGVPVDEVIRKLKLPVKRSQVYNAVRLMNNTRKNICSCGKKLTKEELDKQAGFATMKCEGCLKKNRQLKKKTRKKYLEKNLCGVCGKHKRLKNHTTCYKCLSTSYRLSVRRGFCGRCHTNPINKKRSTALCDKCLDNNLQSKNEYDKKFKQKSLR